MKRPSLSPMALAVAFTLSLGVTMGTPTLHTASAAPPSREAIIEASPQWRDGKFRNGLARKDGSIWKMIKKMAAGVAIKTPTEPMPVIQRRAEEFARPPATGLRMTWLGHSTMLIEIDGKRVLTDPVWSDRVSPVSWVGPKRFHEPPLPFEELPAIDAVVISHDHYDHLDKETIRLMRDRVPLFVVPLGVGEYLEKWGVQAGKIVELDWWGETDIGGVTLTSTPARHFSGRASVYGCQTLWSGWAVIGPNHRVYYSGDTAMFPGFKEIGERLGPFDATMIEAGAYDALWADVHLGPEQAVDAHQMVRGDLMFPVHWGTFDLANHAWTEPIERSRVAAERRGVRLAYPKPGQSIEPATPPEFVPWWPEIPWQSAEESPVVSSGLRTASGLL